MTELTDVCVAPASEPLPEAASPDLDLARGVKWLIGRLSTDNPFYVLSALLVLLGLWTSFGSQARAEQTWALMFGLGGYTLLLALPACLLVRFGGVWEDVRTVLLLVVLMFLATSVTFDETLSRDPELGAACSVAGLVFAEVVSEALLRGMRLVLPVGFRVSYHLALALFFLYPVALLPYLDRPRSPELEWGLYGFAATAGLIALTLLPAVRRGPAYVRDNGSPWAWPYYPWALFVFLGAAVTARSWLLCVSMQHVERSVPERLIFGPYFLAPFLFAAGLVLLEIGLTARSRGAAITALAVPIAATLLSAVGHRRDDLYLGFLDEFTTKLGASPFFLALAASIAFYAVATARKVPGAFGTLTVALAALAVVSPRTVDLNSLVAPRPEPLVAIAALMGAIGARRREPGRCLVAVAFLSAAAWFGVDDGRIALGTAFHVALAGLLLVGAVFDDAYSRSLRTPGAALAMLAAGAASTGWLDSESNLAGWTVQVYPAAVSVGIACHGVLLRHRPSLVMAGLAGCGWLAGLGWRAYSGLRETVVGLDAIALGLVLLAVAQLISLAKAGLLPGRLTHPGKAGLNELPE